MELLIGLGTFLFILTMILGGYAFVENLRNPKKREVLRRLHTLSSTEYYEDEDIDIMRRELYSTLPWLNELLQGFRWTDRIGRLIEQSGIQTTLGAFVLLSSVVGLIGFLMSSWVTSNRLFSLPIALFLGLLPYFYISFKKNRRMEKFQRQLPDALDLIARALKAGHAFTAGLKMVGDEMGEPLGTEFQKTLHEINFGVSLPDALKSLPNRVDCPDLKYFIISVILQRETGGNLAEILEKIAYLIRERFKLQGRIRVLSAEGKLSAIILIAIPFVVALALYFLNPGYIQILFTDPLGKVLITLALFMMAIGILVMKRMIRIRV